MNALNTYIAKDGVLLWKYEGAPIEYRGPFGAMWVPAEVVRRAGRLQHRYGRDRFEYMASWCDRQTTRAWEASKQCE